MSRKLVNMRLPVELLAATDAEAGRLGQTRTKFVERALESALVAQAGVVVTPRGKVRGNSQPQPRSAPAETPLPKIAPRRSF